jgi:hypothetical protein
MIAWRDALRYVTPHPSALPYDCSEGSVRESVVAVIYRTTYLTPTGPV